MAGVGPLQVRLQKWSQYSSEIYHEEEDELMEVANRRLLPTPEGVLLLQQMLSVNGQGSWIIMGYHGIQRL